jgi:hypothetical protein
MSHTITLTSPQQAHAVWTQAWQWVKGRTLQGKPVTLTLKEEARSSDQNALLHALLTDIAKTREWAGKKRDVEVWKRLMVAAWSRARGESVEVLPALDGHGIDVVFRRTSKMTKAEVSDLIEYIQAWEAQQ